MQAQHEKAIILQNRAYREKQYREMRELEYRAAMERERLLAQQLRDQTHDEAQILLEKYQGLVRARREAKHQENEISCRAMTNELLSFAFRVIDYREAAAATGNRLVPDRLMRQWRELFVRGLPLGIEYNNIAIVGLQDSVAGSVTQAISDGSPMPESADKRPDEHEEVTSEDEDIYQLVRDGMTVLDEMDFESYLKALNDWEARYCCVEALIIVTLIDAVEARMLKLFPCRLTSPYL